MNEIKNEKMFPIKITAGVALALSKEDYQESSEILEKINPCLPTGQTVKRGYVKNIGGKTMVINFTRIEIIDLQDKLYEASEWGSTRGQHRHIETVLDACVAAEVKFNN